MSKFELKQEVGTYTDLPRVSVTIEIDDSVSADARDTLTTAINDIITVVESYRTKVERKAAP